MTITITGERNYVTKTKTVEVIKKHDNGSMHVMWNGQPAYFTPGCTVNRMIGHRIKTLLRRATIVK